MTTPAAVATPIIAIKAANSTLTALVGSNFVKDALRQDTSYPAVKFQMISFVPKAYVFKRVPSQLKDARIQFDGYVKSVRSGGQITLETLAVAVRGAFERYSGTIGGKTIEDVFIDMESADMEDVDTNKETDHFRIDFIFKFAQET